MNTITIITPIEKHQVELKTWITGKEYEEIQKPMNDIKFSIDASKNVKGEIDTGLMAELNAGTMAQKTTEITIEKIVVSVDGDTKNILEKVLAMNKNDYLFVQKEIDKAYKGEYFTKPE